MRVIIDKNYVSANEYAGREDITEVIVDPKVSIVRFAENAFKGCDNLESFISYANDTHIGQAAFRGCKNLQKVQAKNIYLAESSFEGCISLKKFTGKAAIIPERCFRGCQKLYLPPDARKYEASAFESSGIYSLVVDENSSLRSISNNAFKNCRKLIKVSITSNRVEIGDSAFEGCKVLESVDLTGVVRIGECVFMGCKVLKDLIWSPILDKVPFAAFCECRKLQNIEGKEKIAFMDDFAFFKAKVSEKDFPSKKGAFPKNAFKWDITAYAHREMSPREL